MTSGEFDDLAARVHREVIAGGALGRGDGTIHRIEAAARSHAPLLGAEGLRRLVAAVHARVDGFGVLDPLLGDPDVSDVLVAHGRVWVERGGQLEDTGVVVTAATALHLIERIVGPLGLRIDRTAPIVDARLPDGARVHAVVPPVAIDGPCLSIRRFAARPIPLAAFANPDVVDLLTRAVAQRRNVLVTGATATGKTTLLNALAALVPPATRIVTIEDAAELRLPGDHVVRLEARPAGLDGLPEVSIRSLVRAALRMRPDRIVIGEVRGAEAFDMVQAMNTGHEGSLSTCHANGPVDALRRIDGMVLLADVGLPYGAVRDHVHAAVDLVVHLGRGPGGTRCVEEVAEPYPPEGLAGSDDLGRGRARLVVRQGRVVDELQRPSRDRSTAACDR